MYLESRTKCGNRTILDLIIILTHSQSIAIYTRYVVREHVGNVNIRHYYS